MKAAVSNRFGDGLQKRVSNDRFEQTGEGRWKTKGEVLTRRSEFDAAGDETVLPEQAPSSS